MAGDPSGQVIDGVITVFLKTPLKDTVIDLKGDALSVLKCLPVREVLVRYCHRGGEAPCEATTDSMATARF